jgi:hypothetical protein
MAAARSLSRYAVAGLITVARILLHSMGFVHNTTGQNMKRNWKVFLVALVTASIVTFAGVQLFFDRIASQDDPGGPIVSLGVGFFINTLLSVALIDLATRQIRRAYEAAFIVGASQILLVNVDYESAGKLL